MFKPIDWPDVCYVQEAVYWIALGRVPEYYHDEHGDARLGEHAIQSGELVGDFDWDFSELEFAWAGVKDIDYDRYLESPKNLYHFGEPAASAAGYVDHWEKKVAELEVVGTAEENNEWGRDLLHRVRREAQDHDWRKEVEGVFAPHIELARAEIFRHLAKGELPAYGLREISEDDDFQVVPIEPRDWRLNFDWTNSTLAVGAEELRSVHVHTDDLLRLFPKPSCEPVFSSAVEVYPGVAILSDNSEQLPPVEAMPRGRGRPKIGGGLVEMAVKNWIKNRLRDTAAPEKREALLQEAMEFSANILGHKVQRTTAQDWLKDIIPRKNTVKSAGNSAEIYAGK
jgi:hypothetical protein